MLVVETIAKIRRAYFAQNKPIKTICREFRVSRRVVRKVIRSQATEFGYQRSRQPLPRIDPWRDRPLEEGKGAVMGVEYHLLGLARIGAHEQHAAVAQSDMRHLDGDGRAVDQHDLVQS